MTIYFTKTICECGHERDDHDYSGDIEVMAWGECEVCTCEQFEDSGQ